MNNKLIFNSVKGTFTPLILFLHISSRYCIFSTTLGSILGGKGSPVITTPRPYVSAKSNPSLALENRKMCWYYRSWFTINYFLLHSIFIDSPFLCIRRRSCLRWSLGRSPCHNNHQSPATESNFRAALTDSLCRLSCVSIMIASISTHTEWTVIIWLIVTAVTSVKVPFPLVSTNMGFTCSMRSACPLACESEGSGV